MSAGDRDTLALTELLNKHRHNLGVCTCGYGEGKRWGIDEVLHRAHVADVIASSDWLREQRTDVCDQIIERIRGMEFLGASSLALGGQVAQQEILVLIEQHKRLIPYRTTEDTDAH